MQKFKGIDGNWMDSQVLRTTTASLPSSGDFANPIEQ